MSGIDLRKMQRRIARGWSVGFDGINVTRAVHFGKPVLFCTDRENDPIQDRNRGGAFYELEELTELLRHFPPGGVLVDIGANVGNHTLFMALFGHASRVVPIEPNPLAYKLLLANVVVNGLADVVDLRHLGLGLSSEDAEGFAMQARTKNLGGARMRPGEGDIAVRAGDALFGDIVPSLIKIDVEGMEMAVLEGLSATLARCRPKLFVEVDRANYDAFEQWRAGAGYVTVDTFQRYCANTNFLLAPEPE